MQFPIQELCFSFLASSAVGICNGLLSPNKNGAQISGSNQNSQAPSMTFHQSSVVDDFNSTNQPASAVLENLPNQISSDMRLFPYFGYQYSKQQYKMCFRYR